MTAETPLHSPHFQRLCKVLEKSGTFFETCNEFNSLKSNLDRIKYVSKLSELSKISLKPYPSSKCSETAGQHAFNALMKLGSAMYPEALEYFNRAIVNEPYVSPEEFRAKGKRILFEDKHVDRRQNTLLLSIDGRVDALSRMGRIKEAIDNLELLLKYDSSDLAFEFHFKKKAAVLFDNGRHEEAWVVYKEAKNKFATNSEISNRFTYLLEDSMRKLKKRLKKGPKASCSEAIKCAGDSPGSLIPKLLSVNPSVPCASTSVCLNFDKNKGRCVQTTTAVKPGDVLIVESPFAHSVNGPYLGKCYHCLKPIDIWVPCKGCRIVSYCNEHCRSVDAIHTIECPIMGYLVCTQPTHDASDVHLALRVVCAADSNTLFELFNNKSKSTTCKEDLSATDVYDSASYSNILDLDIECPDAYAMYVFSKTVHAYLIAEVLFEKSNFRKMLMDGVGVKTSGIQFNVNSRELILFIASLFLKHALCREYCGLNIHQAECTHLHTKHGFNASRHTVSIIGWGMYGFAGLLEHSCAPNAFAVFYNTDVVIRALRPLVKGEKVTLDKFKHPGILIASDELEKFNLTQYKFKCECVACLGHWNTADFDHIKLSYILRAEHLMQKLSLTEKKLLEGLNLGTIQKKLDDLRMKLYDSVPSENCVLFLKEAVKYLIAIDSLIERPNYSISLAESCIATYYGYLGNRNVRCVNADTVQRPNRVAPYADISPSLLAPMAHLLEEVSKHLGK